MLLTKKIEIIEGVTFEFENRNLKSYWKNEVFTDHIPSDVNITISEDLLELTSNNKMMLNTAFSLCKNRIIGFQKPYGTEIEIKGKGFTASIESDQKIKLILGYSHPVFYTFRKEINFKILGGRKIVLSSVDKRLLGQTTSEIIKLRKPSVFFDRGLYIKDKFHIFKKKSKK